MDIVEKVGRVDKLARMMTKEVREMVREAVEIAESKNMVETRELLKVILLGNV